MLLNVTTGPQRAPRSFDKRVWLLITVVTNGMTLFIGHEQSEVTQGVGAANKDGVQITQAGTQNTPFGTWWKGDFWFTGSQAGVATLINTGEFEDEYPSIPGS